MTNLVFGHNRYAIDATVTVTSEETGYAKENLLTGARQDTWKADSAGTNFIAQYTNAAGWSADYYAIARADLAVLDQATVTFNVDYSDNGSDWTQWATESMSSTDLVGPNDEDYVHVASSAEGPHDYWRFNVVYGSSDTPEISKFYIGEAFDMGRDPIGFSSVKIRAGHLRRRPRYQFELVYADVSYAKATELIDHVLDIADYHPIWMITKSYHDLLYGHKCIQCQVVDAETPQRLTNRNDIRLVLRELI